MIKPPHAIDQNHPTNKNVIVKNCDMPTRTLTTNVTSFLPSFKLILGCPIHNALNPDNIVPEPGINIFKNKHNKATGNGKNGIASCIVVISFVGRFTLSPDLGSFECCASSCAANTIPVILNAEL